MVREVPFTTLFTILLAIILTPILVWMFSTLDPHILTLTLGFTGTVLIILALGALLSPHTLPLSPRKPLPF